MPEAETMSPSTIVALVGMGSTIRYAASTSHVSVKWILYPVQAVLFLRLEQVPGSGGNYPSARHRVPCSLA